MKYVSEFEDGENVSTVLVVRKKFGLRDYRSKFGKYFVLEAGDKTGNVLIKYWGNDDSLTERLYEDIKEGDVVEVQGTYQKDTQPSISVDAEYDYIRKIDSYDVTRFVPALDNVEEIMNDIFAYVDMVESPHLSRLLDSFFSDEQFVEKFKEAPRSSYEIYAYIGGLAEHTLNVTKICERLADIYKVDRDFMLAAALLHDIGKIESYEIDTTIRQRDSAKLLGHTVIGFNLVESKIKEIVDFPREVRDKLLHAIISHHSPIVDNVPQRIRTKEAYILFYADMIDLSLKEFDGGDEEWQYSRRMGREIYTG
ncbi:putative domain HDIG-containing protein [Aciduliprofundum sp. MAR08-339]|uniref:3'-5' exoribonuclease YhaM family protein n=1 Tax=Aciduliprofundum sp. (strain MAR08-339) TaxID=673860 RepID=UPI0002A4A428|nr:putative domain HDIG-containing protein [Aciduliprofundum sp. MAR08-339]